MTLDEAIKHCEEVAEENQAIVDSFDFYGENMTKCEQCAKEHRQLAEWLKELKRLRKKTGWIPLTTRPMTEEEREHYRERSDVEGAMIFDCELPEDGQEVLISYGGYVCTDTFCKDDGCYFEGVDIDDVQAWMPLPEPYKAQEGEQT